MGSSVNETTEQPSDYSLPPIESLNKIGEKLGQSISSASKSMPPRSLRPSMLGVSALLEKALDAEKKRLQNLGYYSPLSQYINEILGRDCIGLDEALATHYARLTDSVGEIAGYLTYSEQDICVAAKHLGLFDLPIAQKIEFAEKLLGAVIPGKTIQSQYLRVSDPRFWRRALRVRIMRAREHFFLRLRLVGRGKENYASDATLKMRSEQLQRQTAWMRDTVMIPRFYSEELIHKGNGFEPIALADFAKGPTEHFARLYSFVHAIDELGVEAGLSSAMLTVTLEPQFHPNPSNGKSSWDDSSPRRAHQSFSKRWQAVLRDLHRDGIRPSGLRVVEPHRDGCPHYHVWLLYRPESEAKILSISMKYFPNKLKVRTPYRKGENKTHLDVMYEDRAALVSAKPRRLTHAKEGAQVELSRIDRSISSGASYAMKYLLKSVNVSDEFNKQIGITPKDNAKARKKREQHFETAKRVDAYRSVWGIHQGQIFGVAKCLTKWDELRRLATAPQHPVLKELWELARGGQEEGRILAGANQRGNAKGFLLALGGLDACRDIKKETERYSLRRLVEVGKNRYGDSIKKAKGISLIMKKRVQVSVERTDSTADEVKTVMVWRTQTTVLESVCTRATEWVMVAKGAAKFAMARAEKLFWESLQQQSETSDLTGSSVTLEPRTTFA